MSTWIKRKGHDFRHAPHLTFRDVREEDMSQCVDGREWRDSMRGHVVIVSVKDCLYGPNNDFSHDLREKAKCFLFDGWSRTNMVYGGKIRTQRRGCRRWERLSDQSPDHQAAWRANDDQWGDQVHWDDDTKQDGYVAVWHDVYWTRTVYWVEDGAVYTASIRYFEDPRNANR